MIQEYPFLAGMKNVFEDNVMKIGISNREGSTEQSVLLIGTAVDGPRDVVVQTTQEGAEAIFGPYANSQNRPNGATLTKAYETLYNSGVRNIMMLRLSGTEAETTLEAPMITKTSNEIREQYIGQSKGYEFDLGVANVNSSTMTITAVDSVSGISRVISPERYSIVHKASALGTDLLVMTGTAFSSTEDLNLNFLYANKVGDGGSDSTPFSRTDLAFQNTETGFKLTVDQRIFELVGIETVGGNKVGLDNTTIIDNEIFFPDENSVPKALKEETISIDETSIPGRVIAKIPDVDGQPIGTVRTYHTDTIVIGESMIQKDNSGFYYIDLTAISGPQSLGEDTTDPLINSSIVVRYNYIPSVNVEYFTSNGHKEETKDIVLSINERYDEFTLDQEPTSIDNVYLYVDGNELLNRGALSLTGTNTLRVDKYFLPLEADIEVRYTYRKQSNHTPRIDLKTTFAGALYNETTVKIENIASSTGSIIGKRIVIEKPEVKKANMGERPQEFDSLTYTTLGEMVKAINETMGDFVEATTNDDTHHVSALHEIDTKFFQGGDDGVNISKGQIYSALSGLRDSDGFLIKQGLFQMLETVKADFVVPLGVHADDQLPGRYQNFTQELAMFCAFVSQNNRIVQGIIPTKPLRDFSLLGLQAHASYLSNMTNEFFIRDARGVVYRNSKGETHDIGKWVTIVGGPDPIVRSNVLGSTIENKAVVYAALQANLPIRSSGTLKKLPSNVTGLTYSFSNLQANKVVRNRIASFGIDEDGEYILMDGCNSARPGSLYGRMSTIKALRRATDLIKQVSKPYLGEAITVEDQNGLTSDIAGELESLVSDRQIRLYDVQIIFSKVSQTFKDAQVELTIGTFDELRKITTVVNLV